MESPLISYQDWTAEIQHLQSCMKKESLLADIDFDTACFLYFRNVLGSGLNIDSKGVRVKLDKDKRDYPPYGPD